nr:ABC transporter substrate-binding protein [Bradyrhizobium acaciae]
MRNGAAAAVEASNASRLLPNTQVLLSVADDACDPKQAVAVTNKLTMTQVRLVVGHLCSSLSISASDVYAETGIIQLSPGPTNPQLTECGIPTVIRICGRDDQQDACGRIHSSELIDATTALLPQPSPRHG